MKRKRIFSYQFWATILIVSGVIISSIYVFILLRTNAIDSRLKVDINKVGAFGEFIGGVIGSLWALAGVFLFFQALKDQQQDVETNMQLLKLQIEDLEVSKETTKEQAKILKLQQFETTFFSLLNFFGETTRNLELINKKEGFEDVEVLRGKKIFSKIVNRIDAATDNNIDFFILMELSSLSAYSDIYDELTELLQPYFGSLYRVLKFIDNLNVDIAEQYTYSKTLRDSLTMSELLVLHYHSMKGDGYKFVYLLRKFHLLRHLPIWIRPELKAHKKRLEDISRNLTTPVDLQMISNVISGLVDREFFERKGSHKVLYMSGIAVWVYIREETLEVQIKIPTQSYLNELYSKVYKEEKHPYYSHINKYRDYDFCELIEEIIYSKMILDNFYEFMETDKPIFEAIRNIYETEDKKQKVFKSIFKYNDKEKLRIPFDLDDFNLIAKFST